MDKKKSNKSQRKDDKKKRYIVPLLVSHGMLASLAEKVAGMNTAG